LNKSYYGHGKLLISAEYGVLDGALALALPTRKGQQLTVTTKKGSGISWRSLDWQGDTWYNGEFGWAEDRLTTKQKDPLSQRLLQLLNLAIGLNPRFLEHELRYDVTTKLEFPENWGLGSSSTLIHNISLWSGTNPYTLLENSFGGSGYDIAAANSASAILYRLTDDGPESETIALDWPFKDSLFFVHLNKKKNSREAIHNYRRQKTLARDFIESLSQLTRQMVSCNKLSIMEELIIAHEQLVAGVLQEKPVKARLFDDYPYAIKSLGGWGGDFVMVVGSPEDQTYFIEKGYRTVIPFDDMVL